MATIAEFVVPAGSFPLGRIFESISGVRIEIERVVPTSSVMVPYLWIRNVPSETVPETLETQEKLESFDIVDELDSQTLVRADWDPDVEGVLTGVVDTDLTLLSADGTDEEWRFEFRAEDKQRIAEFRQYCRDRDIDTHLLSLHAVGEINGTGRYSLTPDQREALHLAYENDYYEFPRRTDLESLADTLGIARQSFSDRLRRGHKNLVARTLEQESPPA